MTHHSITPRRGAQPDSVARLIFAGMLILWLVCTFLPNWRIWGLSPWKHYPLWAIVSFVAVGLAVLVVQMRYRIHPGIGREQGNGGRDRYWLSMSLVAALGLLGFCFLRGQTHFLGDGYTLLSTLASKHPAVKNRELGEGWAHLWLRNILSGDPSARAMLSYQIIAVVSGLIFIVLTILSSRWLFQDNTKRVLFGLGILTGGYMLQFFGYVENYSLFLTSIAAFVMLGLLAAEGTVSRWWVGVALVGAILFHIIGLLLVPPALYLFFQGRLGFLERIGRSMRLVIVCALLAVALAAYLYLYSSSVFFRLAFVPLQANPFTISGYTLLSPAHLLDLVNLILLLVPGLFILGFAIVTVPWRKLRSTTTFRFLILTVVCTLAGAFIFDPKLGMPRDWDLFSFPGIPLAIWLYWVLLKADSKVSTYRATAILAITAGFLSLVPRVITQHVESLGVDLFKSYLDLDAGRARTGMYLLSTYYQNTGDLEAAKANEAERRRRYPTEELIKQAIQLRATQQIYEAKSLLLQVLHMDPNSSDAWTTLSKCYVAQNHFDSALFAAKMADGLNPNNYQIQNDLALAYFYTKQTASAESIWLKLAKDSVYYMPWMSLARLYQLEGDHQRYAYCLTQAATYTECSPSLIRELAEWYATNHETGKAAETIRLALARGLDSASYQGFVAKYLSGISGP